jgi:predicted acylesterase/phospholipase RssA
MSPRVQIAFQGGGARFVEMLPIAHALLDAHNDEHITITRVAGSSAGAICAALLACKSNFEAARRFVIDEGRQQLPHLLRWSSKVPGKRLRFALALRMAQKSVSVLKNEVLVEFLRSLLAASGATQQLIEHTDTSSRGIKLAITGSDLSLARGAIFTNGNLLDAIVHSSAIPVALRSWKDVRTSPYVDGGVCENLPTEYLLKFEDEDGSVFAASLQEEGQSYIPTSLLDYGLKLMSASMNHNVMRAKELIGQSHVFEAPTQLNTFDFAGAIDKLADDETYEACYDNAWHQILRYSQLHKTVGGVSPFYLSGRVSAPKVMRSIFRVFESSLKTVDWSYKKAAFLVRADCLRPPLHQRVPLPDQVIRIARIQAKESGLVCFNSSAAMTPEGSIMPTAWTCFNETQQKELLVQAVPAENVASKTRGKLREVLLFFENPRANILAGDEITVSSYYMVGPNMLNLKKGSDYISVSNPHPIPVELADVILAYPVDFGPVAAAIDTSLRHRVGAPISEKELKTEYGGNFNNDIKLLGIRTQNLAPGEPFRVIFTKVPQNS